MKFNFTSQICTTKEQSERLLALGLKKETADCHYEGRKNRYEEWEVSVIGGCYYRWDYPAWSLHRLIEMIPIAIPDKSGIIHCFTIDGASDICYYYFGEESWERWKSWSQKELYDNIIDCIEWLIQEGHFNKEFLK